MLFSPKQYEGFLCAEIDVIVCVYLDASFTFTRVFDHSIRAIFLQRKRKNQCENFESKLSVDGIRISLVFLRMFNIRWY